MALTLIGMPTLRVEDTAELLGISVAAVRRAVYAGDLASYRIGRRLLFRPEDVAEFVERRRKPAVPA